MLNSKKENMRRALIVGINHYPAGPLKGCINDAKNMHEVLSRHEDETVNFDCKLLTSKEESLNISTRYLKMEISKLLLQEAEIAVLYFSGHGTTNDIDSYLVTQDAMNFSEGVSLSEIISMANRSKAREVIIILDCCHSGHLGNLNEIGIRKAILREGVSILTSSRDTQISMEKDDNQGLFTSMIYEALKGGASDIFGNITVSGIYQYADQLLNTWEQRPVLKTHISRMVSLRKNSPKIKLKTLRKIKKHFPNKEFKYPLDPSYSTNSKKKNKKNIKKMRVFREYHSQGLLRPIGTTYMWDAAQESKHCELTPFGKHIWEMANKNQI